MYNRPRLEVKPVIDAQCALDNDPAIHREKSAFFEYYGINIACLMPGAVVLGGWGKFPYGQMGKGPAAPSMQPILKHIGGQGKVDDLIKLFLNIDGSSPEELRVAGSMRPMVEAALAAYIMHYKDFAAAGEHEMLRQKLKLNVCEMLGQGHQAHDLLCEWGQIIQAAWNMDNLHMSALSTAGFDDEARKAVSTALQTLENDSRSMRMEMLHLKNALIPLQQEVVDLKCVIAELKRLLTSHTTPRGTPSKEPPSSSRHLDAAQPRLSCTLPDEAASNDGGIHVDTAGYTYRKFVPGKAVDANSDVALATVTAAAAPLVGHGSSEEPYAHPHVVLQTQQDSIPLWDDFRNVNVCGVYAKAVKHGINHFQFFSPSATTQERATGRKNKAVIVEIKAWFDGQATQEEKLKLLGLTSCEDGEDRTILYKIQDRIEKRLYPEFAKLNKDTKGKVSMPKNLKPRKQGAQRGVWAYTSLSNMLKTLKANKVNLDADPRKTSPQPTLQFPPLLPQTPMLPTVNHGGSSDALKVESTVPASDAVKKACAAADDSGGGGGGSGSQTDVANSRKRSRSWDEDEDEDEDEDDARGGSSSQPTDPTTDSVPPKNVAILLATTMQEIEVERQKRAHLEYIAGKDWDRDFGGAFPDLMVGLAEGLAELKRKEDEED